MAAAREQALVEHYFRHEYGRLVASLARKYGVHRIEAVEDAVQGALMLALTSWSLRGTPDDPGGWLYRVAHNRLIDHLRSAAEKKRADETEELVVDDTSEHFAREIHDDQLRMLFVCCDEAIPIESQLVLALKTLCGFSTHEIAQRLFTTEMNVRKRLSRARDRLREIGPELDTPSDAALRARRQAVQAVIYLLFTEGYHSVQAEQVVRRELCEEAIRLANMLVSHPTGDVPATRALLALMYFHAARLDARTDESGALLLLEDQDRSRFDAEALRLGCHWLQRSADGDEFTRYHAEAGIAAEHCLAPSYEAIRWSEIESLYLMLDQLAPSPLHTLNRAIAVAQYRGPEAGLAILNAFDAPDWLRAYHAWDAALGELYRRAGDLTNARTHFERAILKSHTHAERALLQKRLAQCTS
ncbi:MAG TPA: sigma-70 family RNA polymerase sigma factor [Polyangiales bacterium]